MDAAYLKKNVMEALTEALTSMAVKIPDDNIEYIGKYLLKYVERKKAQDEAKANLQTVEDNLAEFTVAQAQATKVEDEKKYEQTMFLTKYRRFLDSLSFDYSTKQQAMDAVSDFIENSLNIPAAYIAVKKVVGESETLNYISAGPSQQHVKGKKLQKPSAEEGDEAPPRQGISFEAFKLPEVPEEEEATEEPEEGAPPVVKVPPKAQPLIVDNAMREKRCKFFGIPRLGAYAAVPFSYPTIDHEEGCVMGAAEEGSEAPADYVFNSKPAEFIIGIDTVGKYRSFKAVEIERINEIGEGLVKLFVSLEAAIGAKHKDFIKSEAFKGINEGVKGDFAAKIAEAEAPVVAKVGEEVAALQASAAAAAAAAAEAGAEEGSVPAVSELLKPHKESAAALQQVWNPMVSKANAAGIAALKDYLLPPPAPVLNLFYALGCLVGLPPAQLQNVCGDPDWGSMQANLLPVLAQKIGSYDPTESRVGAPKANTLAAVKAFAEGAAILDAGVYPPTFALCSAALLPWLQKALTAREAAIAFNAESKKVLE